MGYRTRFTIGLLISAALHAAVLGKYWSSQWFVQTPETKTTVFRVKVLQPKTPAPLPAASVVATAAPAPQQKTTPPRERQEKKPERKKPPRKPRKKAARPQPAAKPVQNTMTSSPRKTEKQVKTEPVIQAQTSAAQQVASAGRIATLEDHYRARVRQEIEKRKFYPARARRQRRQGTVTVAFVLSRDGSIGHLRLLKKCQYAVLGRTALAAVRKVGRFPPFPADIQRQSWAFEIPLSYRIR